MQQPKEHSIMIGPQKDIELIEKMVNTIDIVELSGNLKAKNVHKL